MFHRLVYGNGESLWLFAAMTAPIFCLAGTADWLTVLLAALVGMCFCTLVWLVPENRIWQQKWYCTLQSVWLILIFAVLSRWADRVWPTGNGKPAVSLALTVLAATSALSGKTAAAQVGVLLCGAVTILYSIVLLSGIGQWHSAAEKVETAEPWLWLLSFMLPAGGVKVLSKRKKAVLPWISLLAVGVSVWIAGLAVDRTNGWPFYEAAKSLRLLGIADRFEALVSVAATLGFFSLFSLLLSGVYDFAEQLFPQGGKIGTVASAAAGWLAGGLLQKVNVCLLAVATLFIWGVLPLAGLFDREIKIFPQKEK